MNSSLIFSQINNIVTLNEDETKFLESIFIARPFKRGEIIVKSGDIALYLIYMNSGYIMTYFTNKEGIDYVIQFATTEWW